MKRALTILLVLLMGGFVQASPLACCNPGQAPARACDCQGMTMPATVCPTAGSAGCGDLGCAAEGGLPVALPVSANERLKDSHGSICAVIHAVPAFHCTLMPVRRAVAMIGPPAPAGRLRARIHVFLI